MSADLPRLFLDHVWNTSQVAEDEHGLAGFLVGFVSPADPLYRVRAITGSSNLASVEFHRRLGFQVCDVISGYDGPGNDRFTFTRELT